MKQLNVTFEDEEHKLIEAVKESIGLNWHDFIIKMSQDHYNNICNKVEGASEEVRTSNVRTR